MKVLFDSLLSSDKVYLVRDGASVEEIVFAEEDPIRHDKIGDIHT